MIGLRLLVGTNITQQIPLVQSGMRPYLGGLRPRRPAWTQLGWNGRSKVLSSRAPKAVEM
jgi:hypothetical protein